MEDTRTSARTPVCCRKICMSCTDSLEDIESNVWVVCWCDHCSPLHHSGSPLGSLVEDNSCLGVQNIQTGGCEAVSLCNCCTWFDREVRDPHQLGSSRTSLGESLSRSDDIPCEVGTGTGHHRSRDWKMRHSKFD